MYLRLLHINHTGLPRRFILEFAHWHWVLCGSLLKPAVWCRYLHSRVGLMELKQGLHPAHENLTDSREVAWLVSSLQGQPA